MSFQVENTELTIKGKFPRIVKLEAEYYEWLKNPHPLIHQLKDSNPGGDLFTFVENGLPAKGCPSYGYPMEWDTLAVIPISSYDQWFKKLPRDGKGKVRKAQKCGLEARVVEFSDDLVKDIKNIYDESPMRQGKTFLHYQKSLEELHRLHSTFLDKSRFIGVFFQGEMIGFVKIITDEGISSFMQIISMIRHRDKAPTNALVAKAVADCVERRIPYLLYGNWSKGGLGGFQQHAGFQPINVPRYFVPLNVRGELALRLKAHRSVVDFFPEKLVELAIKFRNRLNSGKPRPA